MFSTKRKIKMCCKSLCFIILIVSFDIGNGEGNDNFESRLKTLESNLLKMNQDIQSQMEANEMKMYKAIEQILKKIDSGNNPTDEGLAPTKITQVPKMTDTDIETRVLALEFKMENIQEDVSDVETEVTNLDWEITLLNTGQLNQDERIEDVSEGLDIRVTSLEDVSEGLDIRVTILEDEDGSNESVTEAINKLISDVLYLNGTVEVLQSVDIELDSRLETLEEVDVNSEIENLDTRITTLEDVSAGLDIRVTILEGENGSDESVTEAINQLNSDIQYLNGTVVGLQSTDIELDSRLETLEELDVNAEIENLESRLDALELDGAVAFHVGFTENLPEVPIGDVAVWDYIFLNLGDGYNSVTGEFIVPPGKAGLYYFNINFLFDDREMQWLNIRHNGENLCAASEDKNGSTDYGGSACGAVVQLAEGDTVDVLHYLGADNTPFEGDNFLSTFSGFRIAPA